MVVEAPAKVNLFLEVLGRRADGLHDLCSLVVPISLTDRLVLEVTDGPVEVTMTPEDLPPGQGSEPIDPERNLAMRAARLLREATGHAGGVRIAITKRIPIGGGLGGGSADAAATINALNELWGTGLSLERRMEMGARLGCDIPVLVGGQPAWMEGAGDRIRALPERRAGAPAPAWWMVVVNPGFPVPTRDVYKRYTGGLTCSEEVVKNLFLAWKEGSVELAAANLFNSLQETVFAKYPLLAIVAEELKAAGALGVLVSGSGASLFALARDGDHAAALAGKIRDAMGPWLWSRAARILPDGVIGSTRPFGG